MLRKYATLQTLEAFQVPAHASRHTLRKAAHRVSFNYEPRPGFLYIRSRAISSRCNDNFDEFPADQIKEAYRTFVGKPVFVNHNNENHRRARGVVIDAALHEDRNADGSPDTWAEVLMEVDARNFPKLAKAILAGEVDRTSMGCDVKLSICSACGNKATNPSEYCHHIPAMKGQRIFRVNASTGRREGHLVREICHGLSFFENSLLVEEPADPTAYFLGVDDRGVKTANQKQAMTDDEIHKGLNLPTSEQGHRDLSREKGKEFADKLMEGFYEPYGGEENYHLHQQNESMMDLHRRYEGGSGKFGFDEDEEEPYYEVGHHNAQGRPTGWTIRHYSDGPQAEIRHVATPGESHDMIDLAEPGERQPPDTYGHQHLKAELNNWVGDYGRGIREHLEGNDPRIRRFQRRQGLASRTATVNAYWPLSASLNIPYSPLSDDEFGIERLQRQAAAGPKYQDPADHPWFKTHPTHPDHIVRAWHEANEGQKAQGKRWYSDAHEIATAIGKGDAGLGAGVLAAYSPKATWPSNMFNASRSLKEGRALGKGEGDSIMGMHQRLAQKMIEGEHHSKVLKSPKISDFAHLIEHGGDDHPDEHTRVVIDRHALSVATGKRMTTKDLEDAPLGARHYYEHVANHYRMAAGAISEHEHERIAPHQVQAVTWLVQQHKNIAHDLSMPGPGGKGRQTRDKNVWNRWSEERHHHAPNLNPENIHGKNPHKSKRSTLAMRKGAPFADYEDFEDCKEKNSDKDDPAAYCGEIKHRTEDKQSSRKVDGALNDIIAPPEVDTLRDEECPVCGDAEVYDGERCPICGFIAPPSMFRDPNLDMAKQVDLRGNQMPEQGEQVPGGEGLVNPDQLGPGGTGAAAEEQLQHPDQLGPNGEMVGPGRPQDGVPDLFCPACGEGFDAGQPMSQPENDPAAPNAAGPEEGMVCPNCGQATLLSQSDIQQMDQMNAGEGGLIAPEQLADGQEMPEDGTQTEDPNADPNAPPQEQEDDEEPLPDDGEGDDQAPVDDDEQPKKKRDDKNPKGASMSKAVEAAMVAQQLVIDSLTRKVAALQAQNSFLATLAGVEKEFAAIQRQADINNPASPVPDPPEQQAPESTEEALAPEANDNVQQPGETPGSVQRVPAEQVDVPMQPGVSMPTTPANQLVDVTAPVAGTNTGEVPLEQRRIETDVRIGEDPLRANGPGVGGLGNDGTAFPWTMSSKDNEALAANRTMASIRLARLRLTAGLVTGDEIAIATGIERDANLNDSMIAHEIRTLENLSAVAAKRERPAGLVPRAATNNNGRTAPSMASVGQATAAYAEDGVDEELFLSA